MKILGQGTQGGWLLNSPFFGSADKAIKRYITELSAAGSMYDQFSSPIILDGDFEKQIQYVTTETGVFQMLSGLLSSTSEYLGITAAGDLELRLSGSFYNFGAVPRDGKLNTVRLVRVGSSISAYINGALLSSIVSSSTYSFDVVARYASGLHFNGIWSNLLVEDNGTLIVDAKKDGDGTSNVIVNAVGNPYLTRVNQTTDEVTEYELNTESSPNRWVDVNNAANYIEIAGT